MKKSIQILLSLFVISVAFAGHISEKSVPTEVINAMKKQFPTAQKVKWEKENNNFEAEFKMNKTENSALFDSKGTFIEVETEIPLSELPKSVAQFVKEKYKGQKIKEASKITDAKGVVTFEAEIKGKDLIFDANGKFIKEVIEKED